MTARCARIRRVPFIAFACAALILLAASSPSAPAWHGTPDDPPRPAAAFMQGAPVRLADLAGKPLLLYFGYTACPDFCPTTLADLSWVFSELGPLGDEARVLSVMVDPIRDTDERLTSYLRRFNPGFVGARAPDQATQDAVLAAYDAHAEKESLQPNLPQGTQDPALPHGHSPETAVHAGFTHSARLFLIDADGNRITHDAFGSPREDILADLLQAIKQGG